MTAASSYLVEVHRTSTVLEALTFARSQGRDISAALLDAGTRFPQEAEHATRPERVELRFERMPPGLNVPDAFLEALPQRGLRGADLHELLALMRRRPEFFAHGKNFPLHLYGEPVRAPALLGARAGLIILPDIARWPPPLLLVEKPRFAGAVTVLCAAA